MGCTCFCHGFIKCEESSLSKRLNESVIKCSEEWYSNVVIIYYWPVDQISCQVHPHCSEKHYNGLYHGWQDCTPTPIVFTWRCPMMWPIDTWHCTECSPFVANPRLAALSDTSGDETKSRFYICCRATLSIFYGAKVLWWAEIVPKWKKWHLSIFLFFPIDILKSFENFLYESSSGESIFWHNWSENDKRWYIQRLLGMSTLNNTASFLSLPPSPTLYNTLLFCCADALSLGYMKSIELILTGMVDIGMCQRGGVSNKPPWLRTATRHGPGIL